MPESETGPALPAKTARPGGSAVAPGCGVFPPLVEAHRGDRANAPENTLAAFRLARDLGTPWIELDVQQTRDGEIVVMHDATVDRTTDGCGPVSGLTLAQIRRLDAGSWFGPAFAGEPVPTLAEVAALVAGSATRLNVEVKASGLTPAEAERVLTVLRAAGILDTSLISSFATEALLAVRAVDSSIPLARIGGDEDILAAARRHGFPWIHAPAAIVTREFVDRAHAAGIRVNVWTVDDPAEYARYRDLGLDKLCTNRPAELLPVARGSVVDGSDPALH